MIGAGEGIRTLDPNLGKVVIKAGLGMLEFRITGSASRNQRSRFEKPKEMAPEAGQALVRGAVEQSCAVGICDPGVTPMLPYELPGMTKYLKSLARPKGFEPPTPRFVEASHAI